jgi:hypothetical protein
MPPTPNTTIWSTVTSVLPWPLPKKKFARPSPPRQPVQPYYPPQDVSDSDNFSTRSSSPPPLARRNPPTHRNLPNPYENEPHSFYKYRKVVKFRGRIKPLSRTKHEYHRMIYLLRTLMKGEVDPKIFIQVRRPKYHIPIKSHWRIKPLSRTIGARVSESHSILMAMKEKVDPNIYDIARRGRCVICHDDPQVIYTTLWPCLHNYCYACIRKWLENKKKANLATL